RILFMEACEPSSESFDGLQAECAGLRVLVFSDVEALQARRDSIRDSIANVGILKALKIAGIRQVSGHDVDLRGLQPLQRRPSTSMRPAVEHTGARNHLALNEFGELLTGRRVHIGVVLKSEIERRDSIGVLDLLISAVTVITAEAPRESARLTSTASPSSMTAPAPIASRRPTRRLAISSVSWRSRAACSSVIGNVSKSTTVVAASMMNVRPTSDVPEAATRARSWSANRFPVSWLRSMALSPRNVCGPVIPSTLVPRLIWSSLTAASVRDAYSESIRPG